MARKSPLEFRERSTPPKIRIAGWTEIPLALLGCKIDKLKDRIGRDLIFKTADTREYTGMDKSDRQEVRCFSLDHDRIKIPRYYLPRIADLLQPGAAEFENCADLRAGGELSVLNVQPMKFTGKLMKKCGKEQADASQALQNNYGGILVASPGAGKTVIALHAAAAVGRRALVVVPTVKLLDQWVTRITQFTNLTKNEIGIVQGDICRWNHPIVVGMVQSLAQKEYPAELYNSVGNFISDEVHRIGAPTWLATVSKFPAMYRWGLSATPERHDKLHRAFMLHIGEVIFAMTELESHPKVYQFLTGCKPETGSVVNVWNGKINWSRLYNVLARDERRNNALATELVKAYRAGRKILVLSKRLGQLQKLYHLCLTKGTPGEDMGTVIGGVKKAAADQILQERMLIFASEQIGGLGLDQPDLDTLFYALPSQAIEQTMGRIESRGAIVKNKEPLVFDPVDDTPLLQRLAKARLKKYRERGYQVITVDARSREAR
jgi:superfamily II DNA or RNA helicase